ncbi:MAG: glycosyltransferase family 2 protein [Candidatus Omnitrophota bacterium]|nr:glycosyltransferase family 2 protein [Candidatus Omnitrophota bacterium]
MKNCILIPSYNEARTIGAITKELKGRGLTVYVVDDGSTDKTADIARREGAVVVSHNENKGKGSSLIEGFSHILKRDYDAVLTMDGDGQHKTDDIDNFFKKMDETGADIIIGNRMSNAASMPRARFITNRIMSSIISKMCGQEIADTQCGFKLIKRNVLEGISFEFSNFEIESEIILKAARKGYKIESIPVQTVYRDEMSKIRPMFDTIRFLFFMIKMAWPE